MARAMFYFEAFLMVLTISSCMARTEESLQVGQQCRARGPYVGACFSQNIVNGELNCASLLCAEEQDDSSYEMHPTGQVINGTPCQYGKVCCRGKCVRAPLVAATTENWKTTAGMTPENVFACTAPRPTPQRRQLSARRY